MDKGREFNYWKHSLPKRKPLSIKIAKIPKLAIKSPHSFASNDNSNMKGKISEIMPPYPTKKPIVYGNNKQQSKKNTIKTDSNYIDVKKAPVDAVSKIELPVPDLPNSIIDSPNNIKSVNSEVKTLIGKYLLFGGDSSEITPKMEIILNRVKAELDKKPSMRLQLQAFATGKEGSISSARRISLARALAVREYLKNSGIRATRIDVRALGDQTDTQPVDRVDFIFVY